jgi:hypothetical protein
MVKIEELKDILWKEQYEAKCKDIEKQQNDPNGEIQQRKDREQFYVDNMTLDSRSMSIVGKEQGEFWWRFAPQAEEYRNELNNVVTLFNVFTICFMTLWLSIALLFLLQF